MTLFARSLLFLSSYAPLFGLLAIRTSEDGRRAMWVFLGLALAGLVALAVVLVALGGRQRRTIHVTAVQRTGEQTAAYMATYLLPFVTASFTHWQDWGVFVGFLFVIGLIYVQAEMIHLNPLMSLIGFRVYRIRYRTAGAAANAAAESEFFLISASANVRAGEDVAVARLGAEIAVAR
jgi:hypothetical protein